MSSQHVRLGFYQRSKWEELDWRCKRRNTLEVFSILISSFQCPLKGGKRYSGHIREYCENCK